MRLANSNLWEYTLFEGHTVQRKFIPHEISTCMLDRNWVPLPPRFVVFESDLFTSRMRSGTLFTASHRYCRGNF